MWRTVHIISDGLGSDTRVLAEDGKLIQGVRGFVARADVEGLVEIDLEIAPGSVDIDGEVTSISITCPCCEATIGHQCGPTDMSEIRTLGDRRAF